MTLAIAIEVGAPEAAQLVLQQVSNGKQELAIQFRLDLKLSVCSLLEVLAKLQRGEEEDVDNTPSAEATASTTGNCTAENGDTTPPSEKSPLGIVVRNPAADAPEVGASSISGATAHTLSAPTPTLVQPCPVAVDFPPPQTLTPSPSGDLPAPNGATELPDEVPGHDSTTQCETRVVIPTATVLTPDQPGPCSAPIVTNSQNAVLATAPGSHGVCRSALAAPVSHMAAPGAVAGGPGRRNAAQVPLESPEDHAYDDDAVRRELALSTQLRDLWTSSKMSKESTSVLDGTSPPESEVPLPTLRKSTESDVLTMSDSLDHPEWNSSSNYPSPQQSDDGVSRTGTLLKTLKACILRTEASEEERIISEKAAASTLKKLAALCQDPVYSGEAVESGVLEALVAMLIENREAAEVKVQACTALRSLCGSNHSGAHERRAVQVGVVEAVVKALEVSNAPELQRHACKTLRHFCNGTTDAARIPRERAVRAGAVEALVATLKTHSDNASVLTQACHALAAVCVKCNPAQEIAVSVGALPVVIKTLEIHKENEEVQWPGCVALTWICHGGDAAAIARKEQAIWAGALDAAISVLNAHRQSSVQQQAFHVLAELIVGSTGRLKEGFTRVGVLEAIISVLQVYPHNSLVQRRGCEALARLCREQDPSAIDRRESAVSTGAVEAVVAALVFFQQDATIQRAGCQALASICDAGEDDTRGWTFRDRATASGAMKAIVGALRAHPTDAAVQLQGCSALVGCVGLSRDNPQRRREALKAGVLDAVKMALQLHSEDTRIQWKGRHALFAVLGENLGDSIPNLSWPGRCASGTTGRSQAPAAWNSLEELSL